MELSKNSRQGLLCEGLSKHEALIIKKLLHPLSSGQPYEWSESCYLKLVVDQTLNVKTTFLNGNIYEEVIMELFKRLHHEGDSSKVYKLVKAIYELKEVGCANWYIKLYFCMNGGLCMIMVLYVDDFLLTEDGMRKIQFLKTNLKRHFEMSMLEFLSLYIKVEFIYLFQGVLLNVEKCHMLVKTPWVLKYGSTIIGW
jgi:hypothetical protein